MYEDNDVAKYCDDDLLGTYKARCTLFTLRFRWRLDHESRKTRVPEWRRACRRTTVRTGDILLD
jgi:hypothetical protein